MKLLLENFKKFINEETDKLDATENVRAAIQRSLDMPHFKKTFLTRNPGPESEGSTFNEPQTPETLMQAQWSEFSHPDIKAPAVGYKANIPGTMNLIRLTDLDPQRS